MMTPELNINSIVEQLNLKQQLLELIMLDIRYFGKSDSGALIPVTSLPKPIKQLFKEYPIGGVVLFRENLQNLPDILNLTDDLQQHAKFGRFIAVDQEGGLITRINGATDTPGNMALGAINDPEITTKMANLIATELKALGINLDFAPCVDVNSNPNNPIIGVRSFGSDANLVATHGCAYIKGLEQQQVISCMKHFPGHGDVTTDSHLAETFVNRTAVEIEKCDLLPFQTGIKQGVDMIMAGHLVTPKLDNEQVFSTLQQNDVGIPASLSKTIITKLLRQHLGFTGVVASDALDMEAISKRFDPVTATIMALTAGIDLIVMPLRIWSNENIEKFITYFNQVYNICSNSAELTLLIKHACLRVITLKSNKVIPVIKAKEPFAKRKITAIQTLGKKQHHEFEQHIAKLAITLYKNSKHILPWTNTLEDKILIISSNNIIATQATNTLTNLNYKALNILLINEEDLDSIVDQIQTADKILVLTYNITKVDEKLDQIINRLNHFHKPYVMISCRNPYDIMYVKDVSTNILIYGASGLDQTNSQIRQFTLNLNQAIIKLFSSEDKQFNLHVPVDLIPIKKNSSTDY